MIGRRQAFSLKIPAATSMSVIAMFQQLASNPEVGDVEK